MKALRKTCLSAALASLLAACGGGDLSEDTLAAADGAARASALGAYSAQRSAAAPSNQDVVVQIKTGKSVTAVADSLGLTVVSQFGKRPIYLLRLPAGGDPDAVVTALRNKKAVLFAERNRKGETPESRRVTVWAIGTEGGYADQWAPETLRLDKALEVSQGTGVRVALLDTGADLAHPTLLPFFARDALGNILGRDFVDDDAVPQERGSRSNPEDIGFGHGTHVAGLVALSAPGARLMPVRVLDAKGSGNAWVLAEAVGWSLDPDGNPGTDDGAHVINLSLGTLKPTQLLKKVTALATCDFDDDDDDEGFDDPGFDDDRTRCAAGRAAVVTAAAGNSGTETEILYPAAEGVKGLLAVTASTASAKLAKFANRGSWIHVAAPGKDIVSTVPGGDFGVWSGTSMAAPLAAGVAALVLATPAKDGNPNLPPLRRWTPEEVVKRLTDRSATLCSTSLREIDANAAVRDKAAPDRSCP